MEKKKKTIESFNDEFMNENVGANLQKIVAGAGTRTKGTCVDSITILGTTYPMSGDPRRLDGVDPDNENLG